jgi:hypothetical protein
MAEEFCIRSRNHLSTLLQRAAREQLDVRLLLHVIQKTLELEQELKSKFNSTTTTSSSSIHAESDTTATGGGGGLGAGRHMGGGFGGGGGGGWAKERWGGDAIHAKQGLKVFDKIISRIFKPYMSLYLKLERAHMVDLVKNLLAGETWGHRAARILKSTKRSRDMNTVYAYHYVVVSSH